MINGLSLGAGYGLGDGSGMTWRWLLHNSANIIKLTKSCALQMMDCNSKGCYLKMFLVSKM